jgi:peptidoglycan hydrolase-like protein with peptidoglycan-binding domain
MQIANTTTIGKIAATVAGISLVALSFAAAVPAHAQTTTTSTTMTSAQVTALEAQIASLEAQLAAASGGSSMTMMPAFSMSLTIGATGSQVTELQQWLISKGYSIPAGATGYFGTQTQAAVAAYQSANGITPAAGYFGPITMARVNASLGSSTTTTTTTTTGTTGTTTTTGSTTLSGGEGSINNFQTVGATNITLGTGANQEVMGFQFMAGGSDLEVNRIYYQIYNPTANGTTRPWNVFQTATLTNGSGQTVATLDATNQSNYSEDGTYTNGNQIYRLDFENVNQVVKEGTTQQYFLTLSTQSAYATDNVVSGTQFAVGLDSQGLRATDAMGLQQYSPSSPTLSTVNVNSNSSGTVTISTGSNNPQTTTLSANQSTATQGVVLNTFTLDNQGSAQVELYTLPVTLTTSTGTTTMTQSSNLIQDLKLYEGTTLLDTESPSSSFASGGTISFKNINLVIPEGTTDTFSVEADVQPVGYSNGNPAPTGSSVTVTVNPTGDDIETQGGALVTPTGSSTGYPISFAVNGLSVASAPTTALATTALSRGSSSSQQTGTFQFVFNVTAFGQSIYLASTSAAYSLTVYDQTANSTATSTANVTSALTVANANRSGQNNWVINSGQTATVTVTATLSHGGNSHYYYATLNSLTYGTSDASLSPTSTATSTVMLPTNYTTNAVSISS